MSADRRLSSTGASAARIAHTNRHTQQEGTTEEEGNDAARNSLVAASVVQRVCGHSGRDCGVCVCAGPFHQSSFAEPPLLSSSSFLWELG